MNKCCYKNNMLCVQQRIKWLLFLFTASLLLTPSLIAQEASINKAANKLDLQFSPPEWQTAICLPDDPHKTLVDKSGELLYHYKQGGREFGTRISVIVDESLEWAGQELYSPKVPIVKTYQKGNGIELMQQAFAGIETRTLKQVKNKLERKDNGGFLKDSNAGPARDDYIIVKVKNTGTENRTLQPCLLVNSTLNFSLDQEKQRVLVNGEALKTSLKMTGLEENEGSEHKIHLGLINIRAGEEKSFFVQYTNGNAIDSDKEQVSLSPEQLNEYMKKAVVFWEENPLLPFNRVHVPDPGIQALLESSIRNIWQAREIKKGLPAFQVGPTCYRGLWIVDGAFLLEAAAILGAGDQARNGVAYELTTQKEDGRIESLAPDFWKENGIVLWTCVRHARLTQDEAWLESIWPQLRLIAKYIKTLRQVTLEDDSPLNDGLNPRGTLDGGIGGTHDEYTNTYWNLAGLKAFIEAAEWLGKQQEAEKWQKEYDDFMLSFREKAARDMSKDPFGNNYLPALMGEEGKKQLPQRAQWAFCHAVFPGQIFSSDDPLVSGNLAMLEATEREGMVYGTGWNATGIWNYFASFYGHAWLWQGEGQKAAEQLYAFGNHAAPTLVWREEQSLKGEKFRKVGDMPHNWASAEFIRLAIHLLALDRGNELHLFEGLPREWTKAGMRTELNGIATPFGPLSLELKVSENGKSAKLKIDALPDPSCQNIIVHLDSFGKGKKETINLSPAEDHNIDIQITY